MPKVRARHTYPFTEMKVGDSIFIDNVVNGRLAVQAYKRRHEGWNYATRVEGSGVRVWRTA